MMSMYGSVTDVQVFSRELTDLEMIEMTGCRFDRYRNEELSFVLTNIGSYKDHLTNKDTGKNVYDKQDYIIL